MKERLFPIKYSIDRCINVHCILGMFICIGIIKHDIKNIAIISTDKMHAYFSSM